MSPDLRRDSDRTKTAILTAAEKLLAERGLGFAVNDVAIAAGVSKSGLLHHFPSKTDLLLAVAEHGMRALVDDVKKHVDETETEPGRLLRAYVRTLCGGSQRAMALFSPATLNNGLISVPGIEPVLAADADLWRRLFAEDGLPETRCLIVRHAAEGIAAAAAVPSYLTVEERETARAALLELARPAPTATP